MQKKSLLVPTFGTGRRDERAFKERGISEQNVLTHVHSHMKK